MARLRNPICVLLFVLITPSKAVSQFSTNTVAVSGIVLSEGHNQRIEHVEVRLCDGGGNLLQETATTAYGEFYFRGLPRGRYLLTLEANGFQNLQTPLDLSYTSDKGMTIYMKPEVKESTIPPAGATGPSVSAHELSMPEAARSLVASGKKKLYVDKNPQAGLTDFEQAVTKAPTYYEAYCEMAMAYTTLGKADEAVKSFQAAIKESGDTYSDAEVGLGTLLIEKGDVEAGEKAVRRGVELNPNSWRGFYELGKLEFSRDHLDLALNSAERAKSLAPNVSIIYRLLANIHMRQKNYTGLLGDLDGYIKLDPDSPAGLRAVQMREQIGQEVAKQGQATPSQSTPK
jgi:tetratricopeptide (TPR) repeat protein